MPSNNKYHASRAQCDGHTFASRAEMRRYQALRHMLIAGIIADLELQPRFVVQEGFRRKNGDYVRKITYTADFRYREGTTGRTVVEEVKGCRTEAYRLRRKLFLRRYDSEVDFREVEAKSV